jgi:two-component system cell cycle sensor histidine kinase/response regulator CckA
MQATGEEWLDGGDSQVVVRSLVERLGWARVGLAGVPEGDEALRRLLKGFPGMAYRRRNDAGWTLELVSPGARTLTGFDPHDLLGSRRIAFRELIHPGDRERVEAAVLDAARSGSGFSVAYRVRRVDGGERRVLDSGRPVLGLDARIEAVEGWVTDAAAPHEAAEHSANREDQFKALVEQSLTGVYIVREGRFVYVNPHLAEIFGRSVDDLLALPSVGEVVHTDDREFVVENVRRRIEGEIDELRYEFRILRKDGQERVVEVHGRRITMDEGPAVMGTLLDVTERKRREHRYHETQMMEALGRLARGVAHDLNNFLAVIKSTAELAMLERPSDLALSDDLREIIGAAERGAALGRQLTRFGRTRTAPLTPVSLGALVMDLQPVLERALGGDVALRVAIDPHVPPVPVDPTHADEVVMNLVLNARDAMPNGGSIEITVTHEVFPRDPELPASPPAPRVVLEVSDTGTGIAPEHLRHIFEPYFTTKGEKGTGLGLANVWRIVTDAGGRVEVESSRGQGSTFRVLLPVLQ